ncbi:MAG: riboflavin biosynthesis protein RibF [Atopobiaceae bacterium]|nr:riboflavin biosynthesis protein RibF [Atopobiaceae bacterium]
MSESIPWMPCWGEGSVVASNADAFVFSSPGMEPLRPEQEAVLVIGAFDGVHLGHQALARKATEDAKRRNLPCVAITFDPDPAEVVGPSNGGGRLLCTRDRCRGLLAIGMDYVVVLRFTPQLAGLEPEEFVGRTLLRTTHPVSVHVGSNFRFGHKGVGNTDLFFQLGIELGFEVYAHGLMEMEGKTISASRIRLLLQEGKVDEAKALLGRSHAVRGIVEHGRGEGTSFGFPTANVTFDVQECLPKDGVYGCYFVSDKSAWPAAVNVGAPPSFQTSTSRFLEANLIGFDGSLYGAKVIVTFEHWLRDSRRFDSLEELKGVVLENIEWVRKNLGTRRMEVQR